MKIAVLVARILLGLTFLVFGLNGFLNFLHMPMPPGPAGQYMARALHVALSARRFCGGIDWRSAAAVRPIHPAGAGSTGPVIFNILLFHTFLFPAGFPPALFADGFVVHRFLWSTAGIRRHLRPEGAGLLRTTSFGFWDWPRYTADRSAG